MKPEVHDGLLEAFERRGAPAVRRATRLALFAVLSVMLCFGYLFHRMAAVEEDNDRLRDLCGLRPAAEILGRNR